MWGWFTRLRRPSWSCPRSRVRLSLECLEGRTCPAAFQITSFSATVLAGHAIQLSGTVQDDNPAGVQMTFSDPASTTSADSSGNFSYTTTATVLGKITTTGVDGANNTAGASTTIAKPPPSLTLLVAYPSQTTVNLSGTVTDLDKAGRPVTFTGVVTGSTTTDANGNYSFTASETALGNVSAQTVDAWGQSSAPVTVPIAPPLHMYGFAASHEPGNIWTFSGTVTAATPQGMTVTFGGLPELVGQTTKVDQDGYFSDSFDLAPGESGTATATVTDCWGQTDWQSEPVQN